MVRISAVRPRAADHRPGLSPADAAGRRAAIGRDTARNDPLPMIAAHRTSALNHRTQAEQSAPERHVSRASGNQLTWRVVRAGRDVPEGRVQLRRPWAHPVLAVRRRSAVIDHDKLHHCTHDEVGADEVAERGQGRLHLASVALLAVLGVTLLRRRSVQFRRRARRRERWHRMTVHSDCAAPEVHVHERRVAGGPAK